MKPFDLEKALEGNPVKLRDGSKAYVKYVISDEHYKGEYPMRGYIIDNSSSTGIWERYWTKKGNGYNDLGSKDATDIVGMWEEPRPRVLLELPCPLKEPQEGMYLLYKDGIGRSWYLKEDHDIWMSENKSILENGCYFATKEDAEEWLDAMRNARR